MARTHDAATVAPAWSGGEPSPARELATRPADIDLGRLALIGIFGTPDARRALLRRPGGQVQLVELGARTTGGRVVAIGADRIVLARGGGRGTVLQLPR